MSAYNDGDILAIGDTFAQGLSLRTFAGDIVATNEGDITVEAGANTAWGIRARVTSSGDVTISGAGDVSATNRRIPNIASARIIVE